MEFKKDDSTLLPDKPKRAEIFNVLTSPYWAAVFVLLAIPIFLLANQLSGYAQKYIDLRQFSTEQRYALYILFAGIGADMFLRRWLKVALVILRIPPIPLLLVWIAGAIAMFLFEPLGL